MKELKDEKIRRLEEEEKEIAEKAIREKYNAKMDQRRAHQRKDE